jgi:predicted TIM-barrel fold metal-dependent hydrolase
MRRCKPLAVRLTCVQQQQNNAETKRVNHAAQRPTTAPHDVPAVDCHAHAFTLSMPLAPGAWHAPRAEATIEQYLATLDRHGVRFGVLAAASIFGTKNDYAIEACRRNSHLRTTVIVPPDCGMGAMKAMAADGVVGVRFQWRNVAAVPDLGSPEYRAFLRRIADVGWHVQLHDDSFRLPAHLDALEEAGVNVVVDHYGRPDARTGTACPGFERLLRSVEKGRTWVKLSSFFRLQSPALATQAAAALLRHAGPERLMWASDWPFSAFESSMTYQLALDQLLLDVPDPHARRRIGFDTPLNFYFG